MKRCFFLLLVLYLFLHVTQVFSQVELEIEIKGTVIRYEQKCEGALVKLLKDGKLEKSIITTSNGKFNFLLTEINREYIVEVSKPDHVTVKIGISTKLPPQKPNQFIGGEFTFPVSIVERFEGVDVSFLKEPLATIKFIPKENRFDHDHIYFNSIKAKWEKAINDAQKLKNQGAKPLSDSAKKDEDIADSEKKKKAIADAKMDADRTQKENLSRIKQEENERKVEEEKRLEEELRKAKLREDQQKQIETSVNNNTANQKGAPKEKLKQENINPEDEDLRIAKEKKEREVEFKKNQSVKASYESELLKASAENERMLNETEFQKLKSITENNAISERIKKEDELKFFSSPLLEEMHVYHVKYQENKAVKMSQLSTLIETVAVVEKNQKVITLSEIRKKEKPMALFNEFTESGFLKTNYVCSSHTREKKIILKKVVYFWGSESYYKNDLSIDFKTYQDEIKKLKQ